ncbi:hypothetical protein Anas_01222 [Armadillidium nasatum]|uniref:Uncharacterized protein n=1 Tax=Armadillidium nasatum TaxID=96803 RepID=A0A5N5TM94_9CRUS|nr:hypothetical protein Anas_01222 [Armadillidium nasatum]
MDGDTSSVGSEEDAYDTCSKPPPRYNYNALRSQQYDQYRPTSTSTHSPLGYSQTVYGQSGSASVYNAPAYKVSESGYGKDDIYSGSKSLYTKSPPLPRSTSLNRSQSVYTRPPPPRTDNYSQNLIQSQNLPAKSPSSFTALLQQQHLQENTSNTYNKNNTRQESLYVTSKPGLVKPEPVYGLSANNYPKHPDSGDSTYSTYRGSGSYSFFTVLWKYWITPWPSTSTCKPKS